MKERGQNQTNWGKSLKKRTKEGMYGLEVVVQKLISVTECKVTRVPVHINVQVMFQTVIDTISPRISGC